MSSVSRMSNATAELVRSMPGPFNNLIHQIASGTNPQARFPFTEVKVIRGTFPHPPNTDRREVRNSVTVQFNGAPGGPVIAHLFNDGTIKTLEEMHQENNARQEQKARLAAEESRFPRLQQTVARQQAEAKMMSRIQAARIHPSMSIMQKQLEKQSAEEEYRQLLAEQATARVESSVRTDRHR
ncbi:hypothetical protein BO78DRAFT_376624 [Aspergillus sclerotiicarbonarius CBS 121057]|uniref:Uncharacterized protein n=1 Tax=Aspergillus sclerotiicarbonarius (strain CBS 121057 / IBT 28362) TaxID=1448318 RepID=A0A319DXX2_ASPSB|nr:hypothetical protein BO78DRAFT_376624 [Aspergillus sclerotiicarbonarius CBS 121057]